MYFTPAETASFTNTSVFKRSEVHDEEELARIIHFTNQVADVLKWTRLLYQGSTIRIKLAHPIGVNSQGKMFFRKKHMPFPFQQSNLPLWKLDCKNCLLEWNNFQPGIQTDFGGEFHNPEVKQNLESKEMKLFPPSMEKLRLQLLNIAEEFEFETMQIFYGPQYIYIVL